MKFTKSWDLMKGALLGTTLIVASIACEDPLDPEISGLCLAAFQVQGQLFIQAVDDSVPSGFVPGDPVATVLRNVGCNDTPGSGSVGAEVERDGDALGVAVGTSIHAVDGVPTSERLVTEIGGELFFFDAQE